MISLDRDELGNVMCQLCFGFFPVDELNPVGEDAGTVTVEDVCVQCAEDERAMGEELADEAR